MDKEKNMASDFFLDENSMVKMYRFHPGKSNVSLKIIAQIIINMPEHDQQTFKLHFM